MREHGRDGEASYTRSQNTVSKSKAHNPPDSRLNGAKIHTGAFDVHEERVGRLHEALELVLLLLVLVGGVQEIDGESLQSRFSTAARE